MTASPEHALLTTNPFAIIFDCALIGIIVATYWPQLRHLRKSTTGDTPSIDGLSPFYIFFHAIFCNSQLAFALLSLWDGEGQTKLAAFDSKLCVAQFFAQWLCAVAIIAIYVVGKSKEVGGKLVIPVLVLVHAFFFVFVAWDVASDPKDFSMSVGTSLVAGILSYLLVLSTPMALLLQFCAQYSELRETSDYGALNLRSFGMQAAVTTVTALRLLIKTSPIFLAVAENDGQGIFARVLLTILRCYFGGFLSFNYLLWAAGAVSIYFATRSSKTGMTDTRVELGVFLE